MRFIKQMRWALSGLIVAIGCSGTLTVAGSAHASDLLVTNYSFESSTSSWTQTYGSGGITASTDQAVTGTQSLKIVDASTTVAYGLESDFIPAAAATTYTAYAKTYIASGSADLYLRYYNSSKQLIQGYYAPKTSPANQWSDHTLSQLSPAGTAYVRVLLYSGGANTGTVYWDDVMLTAKNQIVGPVIESAAIYNATLGADGSGNPMIYATLNGSGSTPVKLIGINPNTNAMVNSYALSGSTVYGHSITTATDGKIYAGTFPNGHVYQYTPGGSSATDLGQAIAGNTYVLTLTPGWTGKVYGGTYSGGRVFKYESGTGLTAIGPSPFEAGNSYVYGLEYDDINNVTYVGTGSSGAHLQRFENTGGQLDEILPAAYSSDDTVWQVDYEGGKVFAHMLPSLKMAVLNVTESGSTVTTVQDKELQVSSRSVSPVLSGKVYYTYNANVYSYDIASKTATNTGANVSFDPKEMFLVQLTDQTNYPGYTLMGIQNVLGQVKLFRYNIQTGYTTTHTVTGVPEVPNNISMLKFGVGNKIYSGGEINGGVGIYTPYRSDLNAQQYGIGQLENLAMLGSKMYFGSYPASKIWEYDPASAWSLGTNPRLAMDLSVPAYEQERPYGMTTGGGKLFVGTTPLPNELGGVLAIYDPVTQTFNAYRNLVTDESLVSLTYLSGYVYGGATIGGGKDATPTQTTGKLLKYNVSANTSTVYTFPVSGVEGITAVLAGPDNKIWGMAEGYLFVFNPASNTFEYYNNKFTDVTTGTSHDAYLEFGDDGQLYGTIKNKFFRVDPSTKAVTVLYEDAGGARVSALTKDNYGNLYYSLGSDMKRWVP